MDQTVTLMAWAATFLLAARVLGLRRAFWGLILLVIVSIWVALRALHVLAGTRR